VVKPGQLARVQNLWGKNPLEHESHIFNRSANHCTLLNNNSVRIIMHLQIFLSDY
jgi:hypothetical protein